MAIINVLLFTSDTEYTHRFRKYIGDRHKDVKLTIVNNLNDYAITTKTNSFSVMLIGDEFANESFEIPYGTAYGYLSPTDLGDTLKGHKRFCKYRRGETLYNIILELYSEVSTARKTGGISSVQTFVFTSVGGAGSTLLSAAMAMNLSMNKRRVVYISFDKFSLPSVWFDGQPLGNMSDFIFAVLASEKKNTNLAVKAASLLASDSTGVKYMEGCANPTDMDEMSPEHTQKAYNAIISSDEYDAVVVDIPLLAESVWKFMLPKAAKLFVVSDNNNVAKLKLRRYLTSLKIADARHGTDILDRTAVIFNKGGQKAGADEQLEASIAGVIPKYQDDNPRALINTIARLPMWTECLNEQ